MDREGVRRYDREYLLWQSTVAIRSDPVGFGVRVSGNVGPAIGNTLGFFVPLCLLGPTKNWGFKRTYVNGVEK